MQLYFLLLEKHHSLVARLLYILKQESNQSKVANKSFFYPTPNLHESKPFEVGENNLKLNT